MWAGFDSPGSEMSSGAETSSSSYSGESTACTETGDIFANQDEYWALRGVGDGTGGAWGYAEPDDWAGSEAHSVSSDRSISDVSVVGGDDHDFDQDGRAGTPEYVPGKPRVTAWGGAGAYQVGGIHGPAAHSRGSMPGMRPYTGPSASPPHFAVQDGAPKMVFKMEQNQEDWDVPMLPRAVPVTGAGVPHQHKYDRPVPCPPSQSGIASPLQQDSKILPPAAGYANPPRGREYPLVNPTQHQTQRQCAPNPVDSVAAGTCRPSLRAPSPPPPPAKVQESCPFCETGDCNGIGHKGGNVPAGSNGRTRQRRAITRERKSSKMGKWWRNVGYEGPQYCQRCSEVFRDHIMRQHKNSAQCSRDNPCSDCARVLDHFDIQDNREALWHRFDERAKKNETRRAARAPRNPPAVMPVATTHSGSRMHDMRLLHDGRNFQPMGGPPLKRERMSGPIDQQHMSMYSHDAYLPATYYDVPPPNKRRNDGKSSSRAPGPKQATLVLGLFGVACILALVGQTFYSAANQRAAAKDQANKWICPSATASADARNNETGTDGNDHSAFCAAHPSAVYPCTFACPGAPSNFGVGRTCRCDGCYRGGSCMAWQLDGLPEDELAAASGTCRSNEQIQKVLYDGRGVPLPGTSPVDGDEEKEAWPQAWEVPAPYSEDIFERHAVSNVALWSDMRRERESATAGSTDTLWLYQFQCLDSGYLTPPHGGSTTLVPEVKTCGKGQMDPHRAADADHPAVDDGKPTRGLWLYDTANDTWTPYPLSLHATGTTPNGLHLSREPGARVGALTWTDKTTGDLFVHGGYGCTENLDWPDEQLGYQPNFDEQDPHSDYAGFNHWVCASTSQNRLSDLWRFRPADSEWTQLAPQSDYSPVWPDSWPRGRLGRTLWNTGADSTDGLTRIWTFGGSNDRGEEWGNWPVDALWSYAYDANAKPADLGPMGNIFTSINFQMGKDGAWDQNRKQAEQEALGQAVGLIGTWTLITGHDYDSVTVNWLKQIVNGDGYVQGDDFAGDLAMIGLHSGEKKKRSPAVEEAKATLLDMERLQELENVGQATVDPCDGAMWPLVSFDSARCPAPRLDAASWGDNNGNGWLYGGWSGSIAKPDPRMVNSNTTGPPGSVPMHWEREIIPDESKVGFAMLNDLWRFNSGAAAGGKRQSWVRVSRPSNHHSPAYTQWPLATAGASSFTTGCDAHSGSAGVVSCRLWLAFSPVDDSRLGAHRFDSHQALSTHAVRELAAGLGLWAFDVDSELWQEITPTDTHAISSAGGDEDRNSSNPTSNAGALSAMAPASDALLWPGGRVGPLVADGGWLFGGKGPGECAVGLMASNEADADKQRQALAQQYAGSKNRYGEQIWKRPLAQLDGLWRIQEE